jgi:DNA-binding transcriptional MerR regulator
VDGAQLLTIGQVARLAGLSTKALRHYDRLGLFKPDVVDESGYRWYSSPAIYTRSFTSSTTDWTPP